MTTQDKTIPIDRRIDIQEASRLSGKSERTLRRWHHQGKLNAIQENGHNSPLWFDIQQIAALAGNSAVLARMDMLEARVQELERIVQEMQAQAANHLPLPAAAVPSAEANHLPLPAGTISLQEFANRLGVNRRTVLDWLVKSPGFDHIARQKVNRPREMERFLTTEQQEVIIAYWKTR